MLPADMDSRIFNSVKAGAVYFALIFALGFVLGTVRTLWLAPMIGATLAVIAEQPFMLTASWFAAGWLVRRGGIVAMRERAVMGGVAFLLLIVVEPVFAILLFGQSPAQWLTGVFSMPGPIGLAGQVAFALMPLVVKRQSAAGGQLP